MAIGNQIGTRCVLNWNSNMAVHVLEVIHIPKAIDLMTVPLGTDSK